MRLKAPFPWFGGKSIVSPIVWDAFGDVPNYVEPFAGSLAVLLGRPHDPGVETVNDKDGYVCNAWRAIKHDPDAVACHADNPVNECDLHARHLWLLQHKDELPLRLMGDPDYYDAKIAGWWIWGICSWIGRGFCSGEGPWRSVDGVFTKVEGNAGNGVNRQLPNLGNAGIGVNRRLPHLGDAGRGVNRRLPHLGDAGNGGIYEWMLALADRLRRVRVCCGDWTRVMGPSVTHKHGLTGVFLDPPYDLAERDDVYTTDEPGISAAVRQWAIENGDNPLLRIVLCGYEGEHDMPDDWRCIPWKAHGGMGSQGNGRGRENATRERLWLSPHCLVDDRQGSLFGELLYA